MAGAASNDVMQRDLHGAIATIFRAAGWRVTVLHGQWSNPRQQSGPDFLVIRGDQRQVLKGLLSGDLTGPQAKARTEYEAAGIGYTLYHPSDLAMMTADADEGFDREVEA